MAMIITLISLNNLIPKNATEYLINKFKNDEKFAVDEFVKIEEYDDSTFFVYKTVKEEVCFIVATKGIFKNFHLSSSAFFSSKNNQAEPKAHYCLVNKNYYSDDEKNNVNYFVCVRMNCNDTAAYFNNKKLKTISINDCLFAYNMFCNESEPDELVFTYK